MAQPVYWRLNELRTWWYKRHQEPIDEEYGRYLAEQAEYELADQIAEMPF